MLVTVTLIVLGSAIIVFFSQEFAAAFKNLFAIPGVKLLLPLILLTMLLLYAEPWVLAFLLVIHDFFDQLSQGMASFLPDNSLLRMVPEVLGLWLLALLPVWVFDAWSWRKTYKSFPYNAILAAMLWLLWAVLLVLL